MSHSYGFSPTVSTYRTPFVGSAMPGAHTELLNLLGFSDLYSISQLKFSAAAAGMYQNVCACHKMSLCGTLQLWPTLSKVVDIQAC